MVFASTENLDVLLNTTTLFVLTVACLARAVAKLSFQSIHRIYSRVDVTKLEYFVFFTFSWEHNLSTARARRKDMLSYLFYCTFT